MPTCALPLATVPWSAVHAGPPSLAATSGPPALTRKRTVPLVTSSSWIVTVAELFGPRTAFALTELMVRTKPSLGSMSLSCSTATGICRSDELPAMLLVSV